MDTAPYKGEPSRAPKRKKKRKPREESILGGKQKERASRWTRLAPEKEEVERVGKFNFIILKKKKEEKRERAEKKIWWHQKRRGRFCGGGNKREQPAVGSSSLKARLRGF